MTSNPRPRVAFVGMTHLGLVSAVAAADRGFAVLGFDPDHMLVADLRAGRLPVSEPQLDALARANAERLAFAADPAAFAECDLVYVAPDIATDDDGVGDLTRIDALLALAYDATPASVPLVVLSQVPPGFTRARQRPGRTLIYQVETLIFGRAVERALHPERYIVGSADPATPLPCPLAAFLRGHGDPPVLTMRYESAELAKISINCFLVASVSTSNMLAELCERIGADWEEIAPSLRLDRRIGPHAYLTPGLGLSGGNLERDLSAVRRFAREHDTDASLVDAWRANSRHRKDWSRRMLDALVLDRQPDARIAVLGLAYKEHTHSIKNSPALACLDTLRGRQVAVWDPVVPASVIPYARAATSALDCAHDADVLMILTPWPEFRALAPAALAAAMKGRVVIDPYRCLPAAAVAEAGLVHARLGLPTIEADEC